MKQLVLIAALLVSNVASAQVTPEQIFGGILDIIKAKIDEDKNQQPNYGAGVLLNDLGDRIALGRVRLTEKETTASFTLPRCKNSKNVAVSDLRFRVAGADVYIDRIRITYQNGETENVRVYDAYKKDTASGWYQVDGNARCVQSIAVRGAALSNSFDLSGGWPSHGNKPPFVGAKEQSVLTFIGLKAKSSGF